MGGKWLTEWIWKTEKERKKERKVDIQDKQTNLNSSAFFIRPTPGKREREVIHLLAVARARYSSIVLRDNPARRDILVGPRLLVVHCGRHRRIVVNVVVVVVGAVAARGSSRGIRAAVQIERNLHFAANRATE